jgi:hypothetical protein
MLAFSYMYQNIWIDSCNFFFLLKWKAAPNHGSFKGKVQSWGIYRKYLLYEFPMIVVY